jgi:hypothetical protein
MRSMDAYPRGLPLQVSSSAPGERLQAKEGCFGGIHATFSPPR